MARERSPGGQFALTQPRTARSAASSSALRRFSQSRSQVRRLMSGGLFLILGRTIRPTKKVRSEQFQELKASSRNTVLSPLTDGRGLDPA